MGKIWYLLKCPEGSEADYARECQKINSAKHEVLLFEYQCLFRYGGKWHLEKRTLLPGYLFLSDPEPAMLQRQGVEKECRKETGRKGKAGNTHLERDASLVFYELSCLKSLCSQGCLIEMSRGIITNGVPVVTSGPLRGREQIIRRIDRHKRTAEIEILLAGRKTRVVVGLEIYQKQQ